MSGEIGNFINRREAVLAGPFSDKTSYFRDIRIEAFEHDRNPIG